MCIVDMSLCGWVLVLGDASTRTSSCLLIRNSRFIPLYSLPKILLSLFPMIIFRVNFLANRKSAWSVFLQNMIKGQIWSGFNQFKVDGAKPRSTNAFYPETDINFGLL